MKNVTSTITSPSILGPSNTSKYPSSDSWAIVPLTGPKIGTLGSGRNSGSSIRVEISRCQIRTPSPDSKAFEPSLSRVLVIGENCDTIATCIHAEVQAPLQLSVNVHPAPLSHYHYLQVVLPTWPSVNVLRLMPPQRSSGPTDRIFPKIHRYQCLANTGDSWQDCPSAKSRVPNTCYWRYRDSRRSLRLIHPLLNWVHPSLPGTHHEAGEPTPHPQAQTGANFYRISGAAMACSLASAFW